MLTESASYHVSKVSSAMSQQKPPLIVKISSSLSTAIFDCWIFSKWQMNVYLTSTVKLSLVKFHSSMQWRKPRVLHQHAPPYSCWLTPTCKI